MDVVFIVVFIFDRFLDRFLVALLQGRERHRHALRHAHPPVNDDVFEPARVLLVVDRLRGFERVLARASHGGFILYKPREHLLGGAALGDLLADVAGEGGGVRDGLEPASHLRRYPGPGLSGPIDGTRRVRGVV